MKTFFALTSFLLTSLIAQPVLAEYGGGHLNSGRGAPAPLIASVQTGNYSVTRAKDQNSYIAFNCASDCQALFPSCTIAGSYKADVVNVGVGRLTIASSVSDTFNGESTLVIAGQNYNAQTIVCYGGTAHYVH